MSTEIKELARAVDLEPAYKGSWYCIAGAGGDLQEWVTGYEKLMAEAECGKPIAWYRTTGEVVNRYADGSLGLRLHYQHAFQQDLTFLLFPLEGLNGSRLPIFKIQMQDRWFDDVIDNMRRGS